MKKALFAIVMLFCGYSGFSQNFSFTAIDGKGSQPPEVYRISGDKWQMTNGGLDAHTAIWNASPTQNIDLTACFTLTFNVKFSDYPNENGADGIAFVLRKQEGPNDLLVGFDGAGIGYRGLSNYFAVEFDTYRNDKYGEIEYHDVPYDHIQYHFNDAEYYVGISMPIDANDENVENGQTYHITISWNPITKKMTTIVNGNVRKIEDLDGDNDLVTKIGTSSARWGFTSATGTHVNVHTIEVISLIRGCCLTSDVRGPALCREGENVTWTVNADYGVQPYSYEWAKWEESTAAWVILPNSISNIAINSIGKYKVKVTDATNCVSENTFDVNNKNFHANIKIINPLCGTNPGLLKAKNLAELCHVFIHGEKMASRSLESTKNILILPNPAYTWWKLRMPMVVIALKTLT